jgi:hypothetical protein
MRKKNVRIIFEAEHDESHQNSRLKRMIATISINEEVKTNRL